MEKSAFIRNFEEFGTKMYVLAILSIVSIFTQGIVALVMFILMLISLKHIKNANIDLNNEKLEKFRKYIIYAVIVGIIGVILILITGFLIGMLFMQTFPSFTFTGPISVSEFQQIAPWIRILLLVLLAGLPVGAIALGLLLFAWSNLELFIKRNSGLFPDHISPQAIEGSRKVKKSYLLLIICLLIAMGMVLVAIFIFPQIESLVIYFIQGTTPPLGLTIGIIAGFGIPAIIIVILGITSFILGISGYFKLGHLRNL